MPLSAPLRPFMDWPVDTDHASWSRVPVSLIGVPFSQHYAGDARPNDQTAAPEAIRKDSFQYPDGGDYWDFDIGLALRDILPHGGRDAGNILALSEDFGAYFDDCVTILKRQFATSYFSVILGGDHGITNAAVHALEAVGRPVHLIQVDAHIDWRDEVNGARLGYSSPMRRASELPWISGITQIGIRGPGSARREEAEAAKEWGAGIVTAQQLHQNGIGPTIRSLAGKGPFYLTVDADGFDPSVMPAVLAPAPGGLRFEQVQDLIEALAPEGLVGMDQVEVAPSFDLPNRITTTTACRLIINAIGACLGRGR